MATRTASAGSTIWTAAAFSGGAATTAADEVVVPTGATLTLPTATTVACRSISVTGTGTLVFTNSTSCIVNIGDATAGTGNVALSVAGTATITIGSSAIINFISTSTTQQTITTGGKTLPTIVINGANSKYIQSDALTSSVSFTLTTGEYDTGNFNLATPIFSSNNSNTRKLTLGSSAVTLSGNNTNAWLVNSTNMTITTNTAVVTLTGSSGTIFNSAATTNYNGMSVVFTGALINGGIGTSPGLAQTFANLTFIGTAAKTNSTNIPGPITCTGTFTVSGNSAVNRYLVATGARGTTWTITAANVSFTNADFMDISMARLTPPPTPTAIVSDTFTRANSATTLGTSDSGHTWTAHSGTWGISTNKAYLASATVQAIATINTGLADVDMSADITLSSTANRADTGLVFRVIDDNNYLLAIIGKVGAGVAQDQIVIYKRDAGTFTALKSTTVAQGHVNGTTYAFRVIAIGGVISVYRDGTHIISHGLSIADQAKYGAQTRHGIRITFASPGDDGGSRFDNFQIGAPTPIDLSAITGGSGDCGGNSGITFTTPVTQTATGTASFTWSTHGWTSRVPLPQDDVVINNAFAASQTITADMPRLGKSIDFTGVTGSVAMNNSIANSMYGSLTLATSMSSVTLFSNVITLSGRGSHTITSAGRTITNANAGLTIDAPGGTYSLSDALTVAGDIALNNGTLTTNNYAVQSGRLLNSSTASTINLGTTTWTILQAGAASPSFTVAAATTFNGSNSTIVFSTSTSNAVTRTFAGGGKTYGDLTYTVAGASGQLSITGNNSFNNITLGSGRAFTPTQAANTVQTIRGNILGSGVVNGYQRMGGLASNYISIPDTAATSITGDITLLGRVAMDSWTPATNMTVVGKSNSSSNLSYQLVVKSSTGKLLFVASTNGTVNVTTTSSVATGFTNGTTNWVLASWRASDGRVQFFTASGSIANPAASDFTQLGTDQNNGLSSIFDSTIGVEVGSIASGSVNMLAGKIYRAKIYNGMLASTAGVGTSFGGSVQFDADFTTKTFGANTFTESSSNAATVTITGFVAQAGDGRLTISSTVSGGVTAFSKPSGGTITSGSDYLVMQDIVMYQPLSFFAGANSVDKTGNNGVYFSTPGTYRFGQGVAAVGVAPGTSITATYLTPTTAGNLLVAYYSTNSSTGGLTAPAGWSTAITKTETLLVYIFYKIASGSETTVNVSQVTSRNLLLTISEYSGFTGTPTLDVTDSNSSAAATVSLSTTATTGPTNTAQPALALAYLANNNTLGATVSTTNSFIEDKTITNNSTAAKAVVKELTSLAATSTTITWAGSRANTPVVLAVFKNVLAANGNFFPFF